MNDINTGNAMDSLFILQDKKSRRISSYDKTGGNMDWTAIDPREKKVFAAINGCGIVRHIWCTLSSNLEDGTASPNYLRRALLRIYWDDEQAPSVEAPLGDFFGIGHGISKNFVSAAFAMNPQDGRGMNGYFPMPFLKGARFELENMSAASLNFYFYIDYEEVAALPENSGYFHAQFRRERDTKGWAPPVPGSVSKTKAQSPAFPDWNTARLTAASRCTAAIRRAFCGAAKTVCIGCISLTPYTFTKA